MDEIKKFLEDVKLPHLFEIFEREEITLEVLAELDEDDLKDIGISKKGPRLIILKAKEKLKTAGGEKDHRKIDRLISAKSTECLIDDDDECGSSDAIFETEELQKERNQLFKKIADIKGRAKEVLMQTSREILLLFEREEIFPELREEMFVEFGDIHSEIFKKQQEIRDDECSIVIAGETSAGKSSFVNLLLGVQLLPSSSLSCTSTICRIYNKQTKALFLTDEFDCKRVDDFDTTAKDEAALQKILKKYVSISKNNESECSETYKYVDIHWPIPNLYEGMVIVDTPGIGPDYPELTKNVFEYLPKALCFIYVLNTPNAGGVQSDRILQIHDELAKQSGGDIGFQFDPNRALFICNKWDQIHEDPEQVFQSVKEKLFDSWSGFGGQQLFKLSTRKELQAIKDGKSHSENFKAILKAIEEMIPKTTEKAIKRHLSFQQRLVKKLHVKICGRIRNSLRTREEIDMLVDNVTTRLNELENNVDEIHAGIKAKSQEECKKIAVRIYEHLQISSLTNNIFSWKSENLPDFNKIENIDKAIDEQITQAIKKIISEKMKQEFNMLLKFLLNRLKKHVKVTEEELRDIDCTILGQNESNVASNETHNFNPTMLNLEETELTAFEIATGAILVPVVLPIAIALSAVVLVLAIPFGIASVIADAYDNRKKVSVYKSNKVQYASDRASKVLQSITVEHLERSLTVGLSESMTKTIDVYFKTTIPKKINAEKLFLQNLKTSKEKTMENRNICHKIQAFVYPVYGHLEYAKILLFEENVIPSKNIKLTPYENGKYQKRCSLNYNANQIDARVTQQLCSIRSKNGWFALAEIEHLRECLHQNVAKIYGISIHNLSSDDAFLLYTEIGDTDLAEIVFESPVCWPNLKHYVTGVLEGLSYLHGQGLVHKNIKLENILVQNAEAKLLYEIMASKKPLSGTLNGVPIIIAPEVQRGEYCGCEADIFQFAFILWECYYKRHAFYEDNQPVYQTYEELYRHMEGGGRPYVDTDNPLLVIQKCWTSDPTERPNANQVLKFLQ